LAEVTTFSGNRLPWNPPGSDYHSVQFYRDDSFLLEHLGQLVSKAITAGRPVLLYVTKAHRDSLFAHLRSCGTDFALAVARERFVLRDAEETLTKFMVDGKLDAARCTRVIGGRLARLAATAAGPDRQVFAFGEMVACLWESGKRDAAMQLEQLWNQLADKYSFQLLCAYPMRLFTSQRDRGSLLQICSQHSHVMPIERSAHGAGEADHFDPVVLLQQKAKVLETEFRERRKIHHVLREREAELNGFLENAAIAMHWLAADGTIVWANRAALALAGHTYGEYVGHHISEFHVDQHAAEDVLHHMDRREELRGYEMRLRCKDGSIRYVRLDSNLIMREGRAVHTCFLADITAQKEAEIVLHRLAAIVESSGDPIMSKDLNGIITSWNKSAELAFGYKAEEIIGQPITLIVPPELHDDENAILSRIRSGERIDSLPAARVAKNGTRLNVSLNISPVKDRNGNILGAATVLRNVAPPSQQPIPAAAA
jgi:PAS domain S-box-containing protein